MLGLTYMNIQLFPMESREWGMIVAQHGYLAFDLKYENIG